MHGWGGAVAATQRYRDPSNHLQYPSRHACDGPGTG